LRRFRAADDQQQADAVRYAKLMDIISWLDALPNATLPHVIAAQRSRAVAELRQIALRLAEPEQRLHAELDQTEADIRRAETFIVRQKEILARGISGPGGGAGRLSAALAENV
jgi:hypothetical protein